jgi:hypothetical protein
LIFLILDVLLDDGQRRTADRRDEVAIRPQRWQSGFNHRKLLPKNSRGLTFNLLYEFVDAVLRINLKQKMNVVGHNFQLNNLRLSFFCNLFNQTFETAFDVTDQYFSSVFWTPNDVVFT